MDKSAAGPSANFNQDAPAHVFAPEILRAYDIRGVVGKTLHNKDAFFLGKAFAVFLAAQLGILSGTQRDHRQNLGGDCPHQDDTRKHSRTRPLVCVGYDGRNTSPLLADWLCQGLLAGGVDVEEVGLGPTPMVYYTVKERKADAGIMVTGSHNPPGHNGFKMTLFKKPVFGKDIQEIGRIAAAGEFYPAYRNGSLAALPAGKQKGERARHNILPSYVARLLQDLTASRPLRIAWDAGHGATGPALRELVKKLPGRHFLLYEQVDGTFPAHHPDPTVDENLKDLQECVRQNDCDLGIAFDGDGDRIGVVDDRGCIIRSDILMCLYAREILKDHKGAAIIGDIKSSSTLFREIEAAGGKPVICATGHSIIKNKLIELGAPLGGELSGHIFFADKYYGFDDALYGAVRLINILERTEEGLSALVRNISLNVSTPEIRFEVPESEKFSCIEKATSYFSRFAHEKGAGYEVLDIDGVRLNTPYGWLLIRASNTQNALSMRLEAATQPELDKLKELTRTALDIIGLPADEILGQI